MKIMDRIGRVSAQAFRRYSERYIWTQPSIAATFRCRPSYLAAFKETWRLLMWRVPERRHLREAIAVAISTANQCVY